MPPHPTADYVGGLVEIFKVYFKSGNIYNSPKTACNLCKIKRLLKSGIKAD